ncbi:MAG: hypothetical protein Q4A42_02430 [Tissierellia bacterium]|nr:hypothetical protein [Tissierellia bacterium]
MKKLVVIFIIFLLVSCDKKQKIHNELIDDNEKHEIAVVPEKAKEAPQSKEKVVVRIFDDGYMYKIGREYSFEKGKVPKGLKHEIDPEIFTENINHEGHELNPRFIVRKYNIGFLVKHGDHEHFVTFEELKTNE